jgi:RNA polymerase sigma factor (TIGR02999 family)
MKTSATSEVKRLLLAWRNGDRAALDQLIPLIYDELRRVARRRLGNERRDHTLDSIGLVNEAYLKLIKQRDLNWKNRAHFFAVAARLMHEILVDYARAHGNAKRGGGFVKVTFTGAEELFDKVPQDILKLHDALVDLAAFDKRMYDIVELRFFGGLTIEEAAEVIGVSPGTVMKDWTLAKAWFKRELSKSTSTIESKAKTDL